MTPIYPKLVGRAELADGVLDHVLIETTGPTYRNPTAEQQAALAQQ